MMQKMLLVFIFALVSFSELFAGSAWPMEFLSEAEFRRLNAQKYYSPVRLSKQEELAKALELEILGFAYFIGDYGVNDSFRKVTKGHKTLLPLGPQH
ncbi:MAG: hypothetical protein RRB13_02390 [bacterium]|nr:hypothetical protein [bacterium]